MDALEAKNRLRLVSAVTEGQPSADREARLRQEVRSILAKTPKPEHPALIDRLADAFPVWPADVAPPPVLSDEQVVDRLRAKAATSPDERRRVEQLLRTAGLTTGLSADDETSIRDRVATDGDRPPELGRVVEAFLLVLGTLGDADGAVRQFLQENGLGMLMVGVPRLRESVAKLLTVPDADPARHAGRADVEAAAAQFTRAVALLCHWPDTFAEQASVRLAPARIEATVPPAGRFGKKHDFEGFWQEYRTRVGGRADESNVKAELLGWMAKVMRDTI